MLTHIVCTIQYAVSFDYTISLNVEMENFEREEINNLVDILLNGMM